MFFDGSISLGNFAIQYGDKMEVLEVQELCEKIREKVQRLAEAQEAQDGCVCLKNRNR